MKYQPSAIPTSASSTNKEQATSSAFNSASQLSNLSGASDSITGSQGKKSTQGGGALSSPSASLQEVDGGEFASPQNLSAKRKERLETQQNSSGGGSSQQTRAQLAKSRQQQTEAEGGEQPQFFSDQSQVEGQTQITAFFGGGQAK